MKYTGESNFVVQIYETKTEFTNKINNCKFQSEVCVCVVIEIKKKLRWGYCDDCTITVLSKLQWESKSNEYNFVGENGFYLFEKR